MIVGMINNMLNLWGINYNWQSIIKGGIFIMLVIILITRSRNKLEATHILLEITTVKRSSIDLYDKREFIK